MNPQPWLDHYPDGIPKEMPSNPFPTLHALFDHAIKTYGDKLAYENMGATLTYRELDRRSRAFASYLQHHTDLKPGDRLAIQMPNLLQFPIVAMGAIRAGLILVNTNPLYTPREMEHQFRDSGAKGIVILANYAANLEKIISQTQITTVIVTEIGDQLGGFKKVLVNAVVKHIKKMVPPYSLSNTISFNTALSLGNKRPYKPHHAQGEDTVLLQYTGGTTGLSKGAELTHKNLTSNVVQANPILEKFFRNTCVVPLPMYHITAFYTGILLSLNGGCKSLLITNPRDIKGFIKELKKQPFDVFLGINTLYNGLLNHPQFKEINFSSMKLSVSGGMAMQLATFNRWKEATNVPINEAYGLSETSPVLCINFPGKENPGTVGFPIPGTEIMIADNAGNPMPIGESGELCARGPQVFKGYWQKDNSDVFHPGGWFKTGDIAVIDEQGHIKIVDRKKDMILVSGFNVYPNELEGILAAHPQVAEVAAVGVPDAHSGEVVKLCIVRRDAALTEEDVKAWCRERLTAYKCPKHVEFLNELPKANTGKILRRVLREPKKETVNVA